MAHVKKILEAQPCVSSASVNIATETALVRVLVPRGAGGGSGSAATAVALGEKLAQVSGWLAFAGYDVVGLGKRDT